MPDIVKILYSGVDAFSPQPTPFIALDTTNVYAGELWATQENLRLQGQLTGCSFSGIVAAENNLLAHWNQSFQTLQVWQQNGAVSGKLFEYPLVEINSIQFPESRMFGVQDYSISLTCYPSGLFSGQFGILQPRDTWSYEEQGNAVLRATHTISCQPINTSSGPSNALDNAKAWAYGRTGIAGAINPIFISGSASNRFLLLTLSENIDRFNGTYSLVENYTNDLAQSGYGVIRYSTTLQSGTHGITVDLEGSAEAANRDLSGIRTAFGNLNKLAIAAKAYQSAFQRVDLNPNPISQSYNEDPFTATIGFNYSYDNSDLPSVWFDYTVDLNVGTNGLIEASIQGIVKSRVGGLAQRFAATQAYASTVSLFNLIQQYYYSFDTSSSTPLNPIPITNGKTLNQSDGTVGLNATFTNATNPNSSILRSFDATINITPSRAQMDAQPILEGLGNYSLVNLNYASRASLSINGTAVATNATLIDAAVQAVKSQCYQLFNQYGAGGSPALDRSDVTKVGSKTVSFDFAWSYDSAISGPTSI